MIRRKSRFLDDDDDGGSDDNVSGEEAAQIEESAAKPTETKGLEPFPSLEPSKPKDTEPFPSLEEVKPKPLLKENPGALANFGSIPFPSDDGIVEITVLEE